jgi:hypothetical protein
MAFLPVLLTSSGVMAVTYGLYTVLPNYFGVKL